jgi:RND family efflux transporter MFP subunit
VSKKTLITLLSILIVAGVLYKARTLLKERQEAIANEPIPMTKIANVTLIHPQNKTLQNRESYLGELLATKEINLSTKFSAYVQKLLVRESMPVKKGDTLVKLDDTEILSNIKALHKTLQMQKSDLSVAQSSYARNKKLYKIGGISKEQLDLSYVALKAKEAQLETTKQKILQLQNQREYLIIKAPFDGTVERIFLHEGDLAVTAKPILSLSNNQQKIIFSFAKESSDIQRAMPVVYKNKTVAKISTLYNAATNGLSVAEAKLQKPLAMPLHSNINIEIITAEQKGCSVPTSTLLHDKDALYVLTYDEQNFTKMRVEVVLQDKNEVLITPCPSSPIASSSQSKLKVLLAYDKVLLQGETHE